MGNIKPTEIFNLLVTLQGQKDDHIGEELLGQEEIAMALQETPRELNFKESGFPNVLLIDLNMDPLKAVDMIREAPTTVISKVVPIETVVRTRRNTILDKIHILCRGRVSSGDSFRVICDLRGRRYIDSPQELTGLVKEELLEKFNLVIDEENPRWIIQLEVVGENTGISVLHPEQILKKI